MRRRTLLLLAVLLALPVAACGGDNSSADTNGAFRVVTTTTQLTDFVRNVGGDRVQVYDVVKANVDPHDYEPTPADLDAVARADVVVRNGVGLDEWLDDTLHNAGGDARVVDASTGIALRTGPDGEADPHIWHNPQNAKQIVATIAAALDAADAADPDAKAAFDANAAAYSTQLDTLDTAIAARIATLTNKKLVTNHDAFGYYVDHFGLEFVGSVIPSFDSQAELSPQDINTLVGRIKAQGVEAVFSESSLPPKTAEAIAGEAGVKVVAGDDALYGDSLGPPGSAGDTYVKMMQHNTEEIVANLA